MSYLVANPEDRFSRDGVHIIVGASIEDSDQTVRMHS